jgi:hypothetical protein
MDFGDPAYRKLTVAAAFGPFVAAALGISSIT